MNIFLYEWKKVWKNGAVLKVVLLFLMLSAAIFWADTAMDSEIRTAYLDCHKTLDSLPADEAADLLNAFTLTDETDYIKGHALELIHSEMDSVTGYEDYRQSIQNRYTQSQKISVFQGTASGQNQYMQRIAERYKKLTLHFPLTLQPYQGIRKLMEFYPADLFTVILLIYLTSIVFIQEQRSGQYAFSLTTKNGQRRLYPAKFLTVYFSIIVYLLLTFLFYFVLSGFLYGFPSMTAAIQSIPGYHAVPYDWNILTYFCVFLLLKSFAFFILTSLAVFLARRLNSEMAVSFLLAGFVGFSFLLSDRFQGNDSNSILRLWNIWTLLQGKSFIRSYDLIRFHGLLIEVYWGIPLLFVLSLLCLLFGKKQYQSAKRAKVFSFHRSNRVHGLFFYELKKTFICQKGLVLFLACIMIQIFILSQYNDYFGTDEYYYQNYIDQFGDRIDDQTDEKLQNEEQRIAALYTELETTENSVTAYKLQQELECEGGFQRYADRVRELREDGRSPLLLKDAQYTLLFTNTPLSRSWVILLCMSFAFLVISVFYREKATHMELLQKSSLFGRRKLFYFKFLTLLLYFIPFCLLGAVLRLIWSSSHYRLDWDAPANCLEIFRETGITCSIRSIFFLGTLLQCIFVVLALLLLSRLAELSKRRYLMSAIILGCTVIPTLLSPYFPVAWLQIVHNLFFIFTASVYFISGTLLILAVCAAFITERKMRNE